MKKPIFADLGGLDEDTRIDMIGKAVVELGKIVGFVTDSDPGKADRYIKKLTDKFPGIRVIGRFDGPTKGCVTVKVGPLLEGESSTVA